MSESSTEAPSAGATLGGRPGTPGLVARGEPLIPETLRANEMAIVASRK